MIVPVLIECVSVAQLDRASDYGSEGRVFESCHSQKGRISMDIRFLFCKNLFLIHLNENIDIPPTPFRSCF